MSRSTALLLTTFPEPSLQLIGAVYVGLHDQDIFPLINQLRQSCVLASPSHLTVPRHTSARTTTMCGRNTRKFDCNCLGTLSTEPCRRALRGHKCETYRTGVFFDTALIVDCCCSRSCCERRLYVAKKELDKAIQEEKRSAQEERRKVIWKLIDVQYDAYNVLVRKHRYCSLGRRRLYRPRRRER